MTREEGKWEEVYCEVRGGGGLDTSTRLADPRRVILDALPADGHAHTTLYELASRRSATTVKLYSMNRIRFVIL